MPRRDTPSESVHAEAIAVAAKDEPATPPVARELSGKLAGLSLPRQVWVLGVWPLLEQVMNMLVGTVDLALASRLEPTATGLAATDALGIGGYVGWLMGLLQAAVGVGAGALVARAVGARHKRLANAGLGQAIFLGILTGSAMGVLVLITAPLVASLVGAQGEAHGLCVTYLRIIALSGPFGAVLFIGGGCLRAAGDARTPFTVMVVVNAVNIAVSVLLVWGTAPIGGHGVAGIAGGSAIAWFVGSILILAALARGNESIRLRLVRLRPHWHTLKRIIRVGVPNFAESSGVWGANFVVLVVVGWIATRHAIDGLIGSHMIAIRIESLSFLLGFALGAAASTLTGQYLGANNPEMARKAALLCAMIGVAMMTVVGLLFIFAPEPLTRIITSQPPQLEPGPRLLFICAWIQPAFAISIVLRMSLHGAGDTRATMFLSYASMLGFRLPGVFIVGVVLDMGLTGVWIILCADWVVRASLFGGRFLHGGWQRVSV